MTDNETTEDQNSRSDIDDGPNKIKATSDEVTVLKALLEAQSGLYKLYIGSMKSLVFVSIAVIGILGAAAGVAAFSDIRSRVAEEANIYIREELPPDKLAALVSEKLEKSLVCTQLSLVVQDADAPEKLREDIIAINNQVNSGNVGILMTCESAELLNAIDVLRDYIINGGPDSVTDQAFWLLVKLNSLGGDTSRSVHQAFTQDDRKLIFNIKYPVQIIAGKANLFKSIKTFCEALKDNSTTVNYCSQY